LTQKKEFEKLQAMRGELEAESRSLIEEQEKLEKLQAMRGELEAESRSLIEEQEKLEKNVLALEEQVVVEEIKKEKDMIKDLKNRNEAAKDAIAALEKRKKALQSKLNEAQEASKVPSSRKKKSQKNKKSAKPVEVTAEEVKDGGVTIIAIEGEAFVDNQEIAEVPSQQERKKHRFF
jgi:chromosome segregation ATPase